MTERTAFLRQQTLSGENKTARRPMPAWSVAEEPCSIPERKAMGLARILENMPLFIGEQELIVGTRTLFDARSGNEDGHSRFDYGLGGYPAYLTKEEEQRMGGGAAYSNKTHYTPDYGILLQKGVRGILRDAEERKQAPDCLPHQTAFLNSVILAYRGLETLISRYAAYAIILAAEAETPDEKERLSEIAAVCQALTERAPETFREAVQLLWFGYLGMICESFIFVCYGRLDVILQPFLKETPKEEAQQLLECLLLKMYDQADINDGGYFNKHEGQLVVTLGGVLANGDNAVSDTTLLFLKAIDHVRLPEPEFNLRVSRKNPPEFLELAAHLTVTGCNFVSYYNDDLFVDSLTRAGLAPEDARSYGFDLCQDINIPGRGDFFLCFSVSLAHMLMGLLEERTDFASFDALYQTFKDRIREAVAHGSAAFNASQKHFMLYRDGNYDEFFRQVEEEQAPLGCMGKSAACPLPFLSGLYHGCIENAADMIFESYPVKAKGAFIGASVEAVNGLAAIRRVVYDQKLYTLGEVMQACRRDFRGEGEEILRNLLWRAPKWGNDDPYVDTIAKDLLEFTLREIEACRTADGAPVLGGIHQPHPVPTGHGLMATPEGRHAKAPVAVTLTPESGTLLAGPTAALQSASIFDPSLIQWNFCVMGNYYASVFDGKGGPALFIRLLLAYFAKGGMQHQPNVMNVEELRQAQEHPEAYKDLIVRMWGVSAHFVDLPRELQDEMIARLG